ncbi:serine hydrolase [Actinokineospora sp. UTMC 2448]|uniref:serine hydrolase domain-containing protein n=1 Tax=Actinokineospora sp. UTMC 2448 TaxID=2268449 RepID=UPI002164D9C5|nr:serine hydrolase domain-containing protein [Actinokineospora sp. UTMC 2448]UVS78489.1 Beta-lactamase [Actinokineospora sp. UTMC 2448]
MTAAALDADRLTAAVADTDIPDVVLACSRGGQRMVVTGGTSGRDASARASLRYEIGSVSKTFTGLLLAQLAAEGVLGLADPAVRHLPIGPGSARRDAITLFHLITHTSGLPRLPTDFYRHALPRWFTNPYAGYTTERLLAAFARSRPLSKPGTRWRYSNFGVAVLGHAITGAAHEPFERLVTEQVLAPLGLTETALAPQVDPAVDAVGHGFRSQRRVPLFDPAAFTAAGAVRAAPDDLLTYLEAHLHPESVPALEQALRMVRRPAVRHGFGQRHTHTLTWFAHSYDDGPVLFHSGGTPGQEAFLGFRPATDTAVVALGTRRYRPGKNLQQVAYDLLV